MSFPIVVGTHIPGLKPCRMAEDQFCQPIVDAEIIHVNQAHRHYTVEFRFRGGQSYRQSYKFLPEDK